MLGAATHRRQSSKVLALFGELALVPAAFAATTV
jgi:hypothetical protein